MAFPDLAPIGALIADPTRAAMLAELLDGDVLTAGQLAAHTGVTAQTALTIDHLIAATLVAAASSKRPRCIRNRSGAQRA